MSLFLRRLGPGPLTEDRLCVACDNCPDILELADGDFAVIGTDVTDEARAAMFPTAGCGEGERVVRIPRKLLVLAKRDIPDA